ncbi:hypothetical protein [Flavobacterium okayamense]|uniref:Tellurite resistance protein TerB n=1 Tax=Flavobacterium okayamense TaxID=2830782 RepID=A0ABM7S652_9FLAO|nr:hypothetical protein [Flavobacterium okayamense]BCY28971.1 hypothetical protein KK2020170_18390 [Flavobacterium okayamense]
MKENQTFQKILNYLLFEDFNKPVFNEDSAALSVSFIQDNKPGASVEEGLNIKMNSIFSSILIKLDKDDREQILKNILEDRKSYDGLLFLFTMEIEKLFKNKQIDIPLEFLKMMNNYVSKNELNAFVLIYFKLFFADLFEERFNQKTQISEKEYVKVLEKFTSKKSSID